MIIIILDSKGTRHAYQANPSGGASASASVTPSTKSALACITDSLPMEGVAGAGFGRAQFIYIGPALPLQGASKTRRRRKTPLPCLCAEEGERWASSSGRWAGRGPRVPSRGFNRDRPALCPSRRPPYPGEGPTAKFQGRRAGIHHSSQCCPSGLERKRWHSHWHFPSSRPTAYPTPHHSPSYLPDGRCIAWCALHLHIPSSRPTSPTPLHPHPACQMAVAFRGGRLHLHLPSSPPASPTASHHPKPVCPSHPCARCPSRLPDGRRLHLHFSIVDPIARPIPLRTHHRSFVSSLPSQSGPTPPQRPSPVVLAQHRSLWNHCSAGRRGSFLSLRGRADPPPGQAPRGPLQPAATLGGGAVAAGALSRTAPTAGSCPGCTQMLPEFCSHCIGPSRAFEPRGLHHRGQSALAPLPSVFCSGVVTLY